MYEISVENQFDFSCNAYATCFAESDATAFQSPVWLTQFYEKLVDGKRADPLIITIRERASNTLVGLMPLTRRKLHGITLVEAADLGVTDYTVPAIHRDHLEVLTNSDIVSAAIRRATGSHDHFRVKSVPTNSLSGWSVVGELASAPTDFSAHMADLGEDFDAFRSTQWSNSHQKYIDRRARRAERETDLSIERLAEPSEIENAISELAALRAGRFDGDPIQDPEICAFYQAVAVTGHAAGSAETWRLTFDGETGGIVFGITDKNRFYYLLIGCDYDRFGRHSPGLLMYDAIMRDWCERGGTEFDFTIGDEPFKADFGTKPLQISAVAKTETLKGHLAIQGKNLLSRTRPQIEQWLKRKSA
ncbi:MAG: GNAT family N-acetyltransferase [Pseudomonadota bacterium]